MAQLVTLGISGTRSYSQKQMQKIDFMQPLTLIWGLNGSGKTTIIQCLKFITTGSFPPASDRGKHFIQDPKIAKQAEVISDIRLKFKTPSGRIVIAKRRQQLSQKKKILQYKSLEQTLKTKNQQGQQLAISHQCTQIEKQIPQLLGISKPILENIVFCHQDQSLWPFSDSNTLKNIFDQLFETTKFTKVLDQFKQVIKQLNKDLRELKIKLNYSKTAYDTTNLIKVSNLKTLEELIPIKKKLLILQKEIKLSEMEIQTNQALQKSLINLSHKKGQLVTHLNQVRMNITQQCSVNCKEVNEAQTKEQINSLIEQIKLDSNELQNNKQLLDQVKTTKINNQKDIQIEGQIKRAKQLLKIQQSGLSNEQIMKHLKKHYTELMEKQRKLNQLKSQQRKIQIPNVVNVNQYQQDLAKIKPKIQEKYRSLEDIKGYISSAYHFLYKAAPDIPRNYKPLQDVSKELQKITNQLQIRSKQLAQYQAMPKQQINVHPQVLKYTGIQLQKTILHYCQNKQKCMICQQAISPQILLAIKKKCDKTISNTQKKLQNMQHSGAYDKKIDPQVMIDIVIKKIEELKQKKKDLELIDKKFKEQQLNKHQLQINKTLEEYVTKYKIPIQRKKANEATIQRFKELCNDYKAVTDQLFYLQEREKQREKQITKSRQNIIVRQQKLKRKQQLDYQIITLDKQLSVKAIIFNILQKLEELHGSKKKIKKKSINKQQNLQQTIQQTISQISSVIQQKQQMVMQLQRNIKYTNYKQREESLLDRIQQLNVQMSSIEYKLEQNKQKNQELKKMKNQYSSSKAYLDVKLSTIKDAPSETEYLKLKIQIKVTQNAIQQYQSDYKNLQRAINLCHSEKMEEINKIIKDIWREIYHNDDIDHVQILSMPEQNSKKKKEFNYRIVMKKLGKQIEMKGRCSMGQKVLTAIVIRLALAQAFSTQTKIFALDQPTTNLDRQHIQKLAEQLIALIKLHHQRNLQLIVISHDLEFISMLEQYAEFFYEVKMNADNFTVVTKKNLQNIYRAIQ